MDSNLVALIKYMQCHFHYCPYLLSLLENITLPKDFEYMIDVNIIFENQRLKRAYIALGAKKKNPCTPNHLTQLGLVITLYAHVKVSFLEFLFLFFL